MSYIQFLKTGWGDYFSLILFMFCCSASIWISVGPSFLHMLLVRWDIVLSKFPLIIILLLNTFMYVCTTLPIKSLVFTQAGSLTLVYFCVIFFFFSFRAFLQDRASIHHLWEVLCYCSIYQDAPLELVEKAVGQTQTVISNKNILKLVNCWVMTTPSSFLCKLKPETLLRLQTFLHQEPAHCLQQAQVYLYGIIVLLS